MKIIGIGPGFYIAGVGGGGGCPQAPVVTRKQKHFIKNKKRNKNFEQMNTFILECKRKLLLIFLCVYSTNVLEKYHLEL